MPGACADVNCPSTVEPSPFSFSFDVQERSSVVHAELNRDLQQAAAKVTAAEQKQEEAEAQLAAEQEAHSESLQQLEVRLPLHVPAKIWCNLLRSLS